MFGKRAVKQFFDKYQMDDAGLDHVMEVRFGMRHTCYACGVDAPNAYSCAYCGEHIYPRAVTIFQDSRTSLQSWSYVVCLFTA